MLISQIPVNRGCWVIFSANIQPTDHTSTGVEYFKPSNHQTQHEFDSQLQSISPSIFLIPHSDRHRIAGDQAAFWGCGFFGAQDTLHDDRGRHYFKDCYIQGSIDFIFGNARSLYESCQLSLIANPVALGAKVIDGVVTAHGRASKDENSGFAFVNCSVGGTGRIWLGPFSMESTCAEVQELI